MTHTFLTTHIHQNTTYDTRWYWEPARTRTVAVVSASGATTFVRSDWPGMVIAVTERVHDEEPVMVSVWPAEKPVTSMDDSVFWAPSGGWQCLGNEAALGVRTRELDPREAFWNTAFRRNPKFLPVIAVEEFPVAQVLELWECDDYAHILTV